jgi:uncharacterized protein (DUF1501 family)
MAAAMSMSPGRRRLLRALAAAPFALSLPGWATAPRPRLLVLVYLHGGNDAFNTWVPYTDPLYYDVRPSIAVPRDSVLQLTGTHGFHPSLAALLPAWEARELALVQGIGYAQSTQQHYRDTEIAFTANDRDLVPEGWASRALARRPAPDGATADAVALGLLDIREADPMGPFRGARIAAVQVHHAQELLWGRPLAECVLDANPLGQVRAARATHALSQPALKTVFPGDPLGNAMRAAVALAAADPLLPVIHVALNGLDGDKHHSVDTHWNQLEHHGGALKRLAEGLAALRSGLIEIGRWNDTLVATYDEFGRSPMENGDRGTHHGLASTHLVLGGRVKGGLLGVAPRVQRIYPIGGPEPVIDTRQLWTTVVRDWWGIDPAGVFDRRLAPLDLLRA